jgi:small conductance mechanosensitive channel
MYRPKLKIIGGIALLVALGLLYGWLLLVINTAVNGSYDLNEQVAKMKAINNSVGGIIDLTTYVEDRELSKYSQRVALSAVAAKGLVQNEWDGKSMYYSEGVIVSVSDGKFQYPADYPEEKKIDAAVITDPYGRVIVPVEDTGKGAEDAWIVEYYKIEGNVYYVECVLQSALEEKARLNFDAPAWLEGIEGAFGIKVMLISHEPDLSGNYAVLYKSKALPEEFATARDCGITDEMLEAVPDDAGHVSAAKLRESSDLVELEGAYYQAYLQSVKGSELSGRMVYMVYLIPRDIFINMTLEQTVVVLAAFLILAISLSVWFFSLFRLVRRYRLDEDQVQQLQTKRTVGKAFSVVFMGCIVIFILSALFLSLLRLFGICNDVKKSLNVLEKRIEECKDQEKTTVTELKETYVSYAERIAGILKERPEMMTQENLQSFTDMIGADYIMVYDDEGKELITNARYVNMELGKKPESTTYEFRRLLKGIPSVVHDVQTDDETGLKNAMIGVSLEVPGEPGTYGALLVAVPPKNLKPERLETIDDVLASLVSPGTIAFSVDPESQVIQNASDPGLKGRNAVSMDMTPASIVDSYRDFFKFNNTACYGESKDIGGFLYFYAAEQPHIYKNILPYAGITTATAFVLVSVLIGFMMIGYRKGLEHWSKIGDELIEIVDDEKNADDDVGMKVDPRKRWKINLSRLDLNSPMRNASTTLEILLVGTIVGIGCWYHFYGESSSGSLLSFVMNGQWTKGMNLFSFTSILILFAEVLITVAILKLLVRIICSTMGQKGETFGRLALNLLTYAGMIFFVYMALYNLGINLGALVASLSLPAFALSLGAKDLITDIVAGISIVFDGEFKVGDIVDIGGYRGTVLEIGVRTTKLLGAGNNIKIISNRDIKNVINMSRKTSYCGLDVKVSMTAYKLKDVEDMLKEELPKLEGQITGVISGPYYRGVKDIVGEGVILSISVECEEASVSRVRRALNHAIQDILDSHGVKVSK